MENLTPADERQAWNHVHWTALEGSQNQVLSVAHTGRAAVIVAAHAAMPGVSLDGLDALNQLLDENYGFEVHMQAAHFRGGPPGPSLFFTDSVVLKRRSLMAREGDEWWTLFGPMRWCPNVVFLGLFLHLAGLGEELHVQFPEDPSGEAIGDLRAYIPVASGQWQIMPRIPNPLGLREDIARFAVPIDAVSGPVCFDRASNPLVPVTPMRHEWGSPTILMYVFQVNPL
jgi:hypothetical protein